jgi:hypothetical protein
LHNSTTLQEKFEKLIEDDPDLDGSKTVLDRRVPTRWNTGLSCLDAHVYLKNPVQQLTAAAVNKLQNYRLTDKPWDLADDLVDILAASASHLVDLFCMLIYVTDLRGPYQTLFKS